jgi:hypothetical protein
VILRRTAVPSWPAHAGGETRADNEAVRTQDARSASTSLQAARQARAATEPDRLPVHVRALEHPLDRLRELVRRAETARRGSAPASTRAPSGAHRFGKTSERARLAVVFAGMRALMAETKAVGASATHRTPCRPRSRASGRTMLASAPFVAAYAAWPGCPSNCVHAHGVSRMRRDAAGM